MKTKLFVLFVVSWSLGSKFSVVDCVGKEPAGIVCAKEIPQRDEKAFKNREAAVEFKEAMEKIKAPEVRLDERKK